MASPPSIRNGVAADFRDRAVALAKFGAWEEAHPARPSAEAALAGVAALYELLPPDARQRPVDVRGIQAMRAALAVLARKPG